MPTFARRIRDLRPSLVREILSAAADTSIISLAGGLPAPETMESIPVAGSGWQQYGPSEGDAPLREEVARLMTSRGLPCAPSQVILTTGSQQGLDLAAKLMVEEGTSVGCENPTYLAALQVFRLFGAHLRGVDSTAEGPSPEDLRKLFETSPPSLFYAMPILSNPVGGQWSTAARLGLAQECDRTGCVLLEDDPYRETTGLPLPPPLAASLRRASWIHLGSFSKSLQPGLRLGFLVCSPDLFTPLLRLKQAADLHSSRLSQSIVLADLRDPGRSARLARLQSIYRERSSAFAEALHDELPQARWIPPTGGMFYWVRLPGVDTMELLHRCIPAGVAFLPGRECSPSQDLSEWARLNFTANTPERAREGLRRIRVHLFEGEAHPEAS
ncbi:MAG: PLP-dependent aminotransferase family protein [Fibrobacteria bacterium]|nr:PLP-dependent aminotransferase family protein [Fibrobacteria bacterium]